MRPKLPDHKIQFEGLRTQHWARVLDHRPPRKGEFFLSGAIAAAYKAYNDINTAYWIVEPIEVLPDPTHLHEYRT